MNDSKEELIKKIKGVGQDLIDSAEAIVHSLEGQYNNNFEIHVYFACDGDFHRIPEIVVSTSMLSKNYIEREYGGENETTKKTDL